MKEPIGIDAYHLFCFRLLVITIKIMAESMDTSEVTIADEDDRKLFVGGLPQVLVFVSWCDLPSTWFSDHP